jgi:thioredoxin-like negative regulator of GroEL
MAMISRVLLRTRPIDFVDAMAKQPAERLSEVAEDFHVKGFQQELRRANQQFQKGDVNGAITAVKKVLTESSAYIEIQFKGTLQLGELEVYQLMKSTEPQARVPEKKIETALKLCSMAKREPRYLHRAAQLQRSAAELAVTVQ